MGARKPRSEQDQAVENHGRFEKDGVERDAGTAADAVALKFDGWQRLDTPQPPADPSA